MPKLPFSNKQKKKQLQEKRERNRVKQEGNDTGSGNCPSGHNANGDIIRINQQPSKSNKNGRNSNRFQLHFEKENKDELETRKKTARERVLQPVSDKELEVDIDDIYPSEKGLGLPRRPSWSYDMEPKELLRKEEKSYRDYLEDLHSRNPPGSLSHFEHNLETWRQLWRVLEMSDVILLIVDIRHVVLHFPPALYHYITDELHKQVVLVLNKVDLCPPPLVVAWKHYLASKFPHLNTVCFTSYPGEPVLQKKRCMRRGVWDMAGGPMEILKACQEITAGRVDLSSWEKKIQRDAVAEQQASGGDQSDEGLESVLMELHSDAAMKRSGPTQELYKDGVLTLGCIGFPNVGKSSVLNRLVGRKVVSVSRTPGHTKYFQTYYLTPTVKLCDCPGLVFPSRVNKQLQILAGIYPVAQVREPYTTVGYLCERTPFLSVLKLEHPSLQDVPAHLRQQKQGKQSWTAWDVCEAWAEKRGYKTKQAGRNDVHRAANCLLRMAIQGRLCLCLRPPGYSCLRESWEKHPDLPEVMALMGRTGEERDEKEEENGEESSSEPEEVEERVRDANDANDDDEDGDDEDEGLGDLSRSFNTFNILQQFKILN